MVGGLLALLVGLPAAGQHPLPPLHQPLSVRVSRSDLIVLGRVTTLAPGRLEVERVEALRGEVPEHFEVKHPPGAAAGPGVGDLVVLFLRGARSPYVHADEARQRVRFEQPDTARRIAAAVKEFLQAEGDRDRLLALHRAWLASPDGQLSQLAVNAFLLAEPPFGPLPASAARELARAAADPARGLEERRRCAAVATTHAEGLAELLALVPGPALTADEGITERALRVGASRRSPGTTDALLRALAHPDHEIRRAGLSVAGDRGPLGVPREVVARIAEGDPDPEARLRAERVLEKLQD